MLQKNLIAVADLRLTVVELSQTVLFIGLVCTVVLFIAVLIVRRKTPQLKLPVFLALATVVGMTSVAFATGGMYLAAKSPTGPQERSADVAFWACNRQLELRDPNMWSQKIGSAVRFEKNDGRLYYQGIPTTSADMSAGAFITDLGGYFSNAGFVLPLEESQPFVDGFDAGQLQPFIVTQRDGIYGSFVSGQSCDGGEPAEVQLFVLHYDPTIHDYRQAKIEQVANYEISEALNTAESDCLIIEFDQPKDRTNHLCINGDKQAKMSIQYPEMLRK